MLCNYTPSALEDWVTTFYQRLQIFKPSDLDEKRICGALHIHLLYRPVNSFSMQQGRFKSITINSELSQEKQREEFYHELCHILRHVGKQYMMPKAFRELQENDANNFMRYAAIPFHMLSHFSLQDPWLISTLAYHFKVTPTLCEQRMKRIKDRCLAQYIAENKEHYSD